MAYDKLQHCRYGDDGGEDDAGKQPWRLKLEALPYGIAAALSVSVKGKLSVRHCCDSLGDSLSNPTHDGAY